jgi:hypothetical protein
VIDAIAFIVPPHLVHLITSTSKMRPRHAAHPFTAAATTFRSNPKFKTEVWAQRRSQQML